MFREISRHHRRLRHRQCAQSIGIRAISIASCSTTPRRWSAFSARSARRSNLELDRGQPFAEAVAERVALYPDFADLIRAYDARWTR